MKLPSDHPLAILWGDLDPDPSWRKDAPCYESGIDFFSSHQQHLAKAICATCHVRAECLDRALLNNEEFGVWGGLNQKELAVLRKERAADGQLQPS